MSLITSQTIREAYTFDDVLIVPQWSDIKSRQHIYLGQTLWGRDITLPIVSAAMDYVTGFEMAEQMGLEGGFGTLHRFNSQQEQHDAVFNLAQKNLPAVMSVGVRNITDTLNKIEPVHHLLFAVNIDVAHGHHSRVGQTISSIKEAYPDLKVIAGNVVTTDGARWLVDSGADAIKIGIGPGSVCTTRAVTGVGFPQLSAIKEIAEDRDFYYREVKLIADGGIKSSGDIVKALGVGADLVMLGYLLAGHDECPGDSRMVGYTTYKPFRGQSIFGSNGHRSSPEGIEGLIEARGPVAPTLRKLGEGIRSGMSYVGARNLSTLREHIEFIKISGSTHLENSARVKEIV